jgi:plasmid stabilization system protein ParE
MRVVWADSALDELDGIRAFYDLETGGRQAGARVGQAILDAANSLARFPWQGHIGIDGSREWLVQKYPQYLLIYDVHGDGEFIEIISVYHQSRSDRPSIHGL